MSDARRTGTVPESPILLVTQEVKRNHVVCFDVDDTLVMWGLPGHETMLPFDCHGAIENLHPHRDHVTQLRRHHEAGHFVIVWSAGGFEWAQSVVKGLGIEAYVDLVIAKPFAVWDDMEPTAWMPKRHYADFKMPKEPT